MIAQELSYYPAPYDEDALRMERLAAKRDALTADVGNAAIFAFTGGMIESSMSHEKQATPEHSEQASEQIEHLQRQFGGVALNGLTDPVKSDEYAAAMRNVNRSQFDLAA